MMSMRIFFTLGMCGLMAACSSIDRVNGVSISSTEEGDSSYCARRPEVCILAGVLITAGVVVVALNARNRDDREETSAAAAVSDRRLKRQVRRLATLDNGLKLYTFKYLRDERTFVGVMAQDLIEQPQFRHAVSTNGRGFHVVDYGRLGVETIGLAKMIEAGRAAKLAQSLARH